LDVLCNSQHVGHVVRAGLYVDGSVTPLISFRIEDFDLAVKFHAQPLYVAPMKPNDGTDGFARDMDYLAADNSDALQ
jgi:hypothetical protein